RSPGGMGNPAPPSWRLDQLLVLPARHDHQYCSDQVQSRDAAGSSDSYRPIRVCFPCRRAASPTRRLKRRPNTGDRLRRGADRGLDSASADVSDALKEPSATLWLVSVEPEYGDKHQQLQTWLDQHATLLDRAPLANLELRHYRGPLR